jgi:putative transposase
MKENKVLRTDILCSNLTKSKEQDIIKVLKAYRCCAIAIQREQWNFFFSTGKFDKLRSKGDKDPNSKRYTAISGSAARVQMCRSQVVGQLQSWISNRANDFREIVVASKIDEAIKHMLFSINVKQVWFSRDEIVCGKQVIPSNIMKLARKIMTHVMKKHSRPDLSKISMWVDERVAAISRPVSASQDGRIAWWINMSTMSKGRKIYIPLIGYDYHNSRQGKVSNGVQIGLNENGKLQFGVVTDIGEHCSNIKTNYNGGQEPLAIDFGLSTMFATSNGQLLGNDFLKKLSRYDALLAMIARHQQRSGKKPRDSKRYRKTVQKVRGYLKTEIGRIMNKLVADNKPSELIFEKLDFRNPNLSKRLNRILQNCGRSAIKTKLNDINDKFGIEIKECNPAYTSQTCSNPKCGYIDKRNRPSQAKFKCLWCGKTMHADLNAAQNIGLRRASSIGSVKLRKDAVLVELVRQFNKRRICSFRSYSNGNSGVPADPRSKNPYFKGIFGFGEVKLS